jgi:hypothetical protein
VGLGPAEEPFFTPEFGLMVLGSIDGDHPDLGNHPACGLCARCGNRMAICYKCHIEMMGESK